VTRDRQQTGGHCSDQPDVQFLGASETSKFGLLRTTLQWHSTQFTRKVDPIKCNPARPSFPKFSEICGANWSRVFLRDLLTIFRRYANHPSQGSFHGERKNVVSSSRLLQLGFRSGFIALAYKYYIPLVRADYPTIFMKGQPATMQRRVQYSIVPLGLLSVVFCLYIFLGIDFIPQMPKFQNVIPEPLSACFNGSLGFGKVMLLSLPAYVSLLP
jgi:hypothetical protein